MGKGGREIELAMRFLAHAHAARSFRHPGGNIARIVEALCEPVHIRSRWKIPRVAAVISRSSRIPQGANTGPATNPRSRAVALRAVAAQKIAVAVEIHHRVGDFVRAVPGIEIEHLVVLAAAVLAISPKPQQDIGLLAAQMIFEEFGRASAIEDGAVQEVAAFGFDAVLLRLRDAGEN